MKLEEAISRLIHIAAIKDLNNRPDEEKAVRLGIEALKRQKEEELLAVWYFPRPLPGETE